MNRRRNDMHPDLRIAFESAAEVVIDALDQHLDHGVDEALLRRVVEWARKRRDELVRYERRHGIELARDERPRTVAEMFDELLASAEVAGDVAESAR